MKLSIITICYNSESTIEHTIKSIVSQKSKLFEYIIVDGGSTDSTLNILDKYSHSIDKIISEKDDGISDAFNKGIALAKGEFIWLVNSDDIVNDNAIASVLSNLSSDIDIYCFSMQINRNNKVINVISDDCKLLSGMSVAHPGTIVSKNVYNKIGNFNTKYKLSMDYDFLIRAKKSGFIFKSSKYSIIQMTSGGVSDLYPFRAVYECFKVRLNNQCGFFESVLFLFSYMSKRVFCYYRELL